MMEFYESQDEDWINSEKPLIKIVEVANLIELEATINSFFGMGLKLLKIERLRDSFFQSFIIYFGNKAAVAAKLFDEDSLETETHEAGDDAGETPEIPEPNKPLGGVV